MTNARRKQLAWIEAILDHKGWNRTKLAREAGVDPSTLSRFVTDPHNKAQLQMNSVEKISHVAGLRPYETIAPVRAQGLAEIEAEPFDEFGAAGVVNMAISALRQGKNSVESWILRSRALEHEGYMPGDVLMVDTNATAISGDTVAAKVYDRTGLSETVMRIFEHPFLIAATTDPKLRKPLLVDDERVSVFGVVVASFRPRRHH